MRNFAEEIAYLYFRLNGFFLLDNYVTHAGESENRSHADSDLLGIRTNKVYEDAGLRTSFDVHVKLRHILGDCEFTGLICEVKGGDSNDWTLSENKLLPCIRRIGLLDQFETVFAIHELRERNIYTSYDKTRRIIKIVATNNPNQDEIANRWFHLTLDEMLAFIERRARRYPEKARGWNFYSSNLFQYLLKKNQQR